MVRYKAIAGGCGSGNIESHAYNNIKFPTHTRAEYWRKPHDWHESSVKTILNNPTYLGKIVSGRPQGTVLQMQGHHTPCRRKAGSWWMGCMKPIDQTTWDLAQKSWPSEAQRHSGAPADLRGPCQMLRLRLRSQLFLQQGQPRYQCSLYGTKGKGYCKSHFITYDDLYNAVFMTS
jgi:hypothetical protein